MEITIHGIKKIEKETSNHLTDNPAYVCKKIKIIYLDSENKEVELVIKLFADTKDALKNI